MSADFPKRFFQRFTYSPTLILTISSLLVGLFTGVSVWLFKFLFQTLQRILYLQITGWVVILIPVVGGLLVSIITIRWIGNEKLHGTAAIMQAVALSGGRLHYEKTPVKTLAAVLSIGTGASVGPEDPSVQIGSSIGSLFGQLFRQPEDRIRTLVAAGAASAIAAAFNAPIAGVFFALEIILGEIGAGTLGMVLIASVTSSVFTQAVSGNSPAFLVPAYDFVSMLEIPLYLVLGLLAGPISAAYVHLVYLFQDVFSRWHVSRYVKTVSAGLVIGLVGYFFPQSLGVGYETIGAVLNQTQTGVTLILILLTTKLILTPVSIGGGFVGGVFAPSLFLGSMLGGAFGWTASAVFPGLGLHPAAFALVGMAAVLAGAVHAPLTAILLLFEMTNDYRIILPLMFAVAVSLIVSQKLQKDSVYNLGLARHGIRLDRGRDLEVLSGLTVDEVMCRQTDVLDENLTRQQAVDHLTASHHHGLPVVDSENHLTGILTLQDLKDSGSGTVADLCTREVEVAFPDERLSMALRRMSLRNVGRLPVVARDDPRRLVGILRRSDIIQSYELALTRRTARRHREMEARLDAMTPVNVNITDIGVETDSAAANHAMKEIPFPRECVIATVRRGNQVFIPRGETIIRPGDVLIVVAGGQALSAAIELCRER